MYRTVQIDQNLFCEILALLFSRLSPEEQHEWLQKNGSVVCSLGVDECIIAMHTVNNNNFKKMISDFWSPNEIMTKDIPVKTILQKIGDTCYENHVEFSFDNGKDNMDVTLTMAPFSTKDPSKLYYSAPLFRAIINQYQMDANDTFIFTKAKKGNDTFIVFNVKVDGTIIDLNVNISDNPT